MTLRANRADLTDGCNLALVTVDMLPDVAFLRIFGFYVELVTGKNLDRNAAAISDANNSRSPAQNFRNEIMPAIPASFLGGSAPPRLRELWIPFPGLPNLLSSATDVVALHLLNIMIPNFGYISPEEIVSGLSVLTGLHHYSPTSRSPY